MKNSKLVLFIFFTSFVLMSFSEAENNRITEESTAVADSSPNFNQNGWSEWKTTSCFRYLKYKIKKASNENGEWYIKFKNNYNKNISMSIEVSGNVSGRTDSGRFTVRSSNEQSQYYFVSKSSNSISFTLKKVKFGKDSWSGPYAACDH